MELNDFVSQAIVQIVRAVIDAQKQLEGTNALVNPSMKYLDKESTEIAADRGGHVVSEIQFDIAVTATSASGAKGGIGVVSGVFNLGSRITSDRATETISRLKFSVPIMFPVHNNLSGEIHRIVS